MPKNTDVFAQTRTARGSVPIASAEAVLQGNPCEPHDMDAIRFTALAATELAHKRANSHADSTPKNTLDVPAEESAGPKSSKAAHPLLELASSLVLMKQLGPDGEEIAASGIDTKSLVTFAQTYGPLLARAPYAQGSIAAQSEVDTVTDTKDASRLAATTSNDTALPAQLAPALQTPLPLVADLPFDEPSALWGSAALVANLAVTLQEFVTENMPLAALPAKLPNLVKWPVTNMQNGSSFPVFTLSLPASEAYAQWLDVPAFVRREASESHIDYAFLTSVADEGMASVDLVVASLDHELTASDYRSLSIACDLSPEVDASVWENLHLDEADAAEEPGTRADIEEPGAVACAHPQKDAPGVIPQAFSGNGSVNATDEALDAATTQDEGDILDELPITTDDLRTLRSMVRALIAAHMRDTRVDLFSSDEETGYLAFDSFLSWMWYDFSRSLDVARIRYCKLCGRAFPLVGHRGPDKYFCSLTCKNNNRNSNNGQRRNKVRELFREQNKSVSELAAQYFADESRSEGERRVREYLSSWPTLKHDIDDDIAEHGWEGSTLFRRCVKEGLDYKRFLSARRQAEFKKLLDARRRQ